MPKKSYLQKDNNSVNLQALSRYLYSKVMEASTKFITVILTENELLFLRTYHVRFYSKKNGTYQVDANKLKMLFCN